MKKDLLVLGFVVLILVIAARGTKIQTVEEYYATHIMFIIVFISFLFSFKCQSFISHISSGSW